MEQIISALIIVLGMACIIHPRTTRAYCHYFKEYLRKYWHNQKYYKSPEKYKKHRSRHCCKGHGETYEIY